MESLERKEKAPATPERIAIKARESGLTDDEYYDSWIQAVKGCNRGRVNDEQ